MTPDITLFDNIPQELRAIPQWVVWRGSKHPLQARNPGQNASIHDPAHWATFDEAVTAVRTQGMSGIGLVLTKNRNVTIIDLDDIERVDPKFRQERSKMEEYLLRNTKSYLENSPSGKGKHLVMQGKLRGGGRRISKLQVEMYDSDRYMTFTGQALPERLQLVDEQPMISTLEEQFDQYQKYGAAGGGTEVENTDYLRPTLSDQELWDALLTHDPEFLLRFNGQIGFEPGKWSDTFMLLVRELDRFVGDVARVKNIIMSSPMVLQSPVSRAGESRIHKADRLFQGVLAYSRKENNFQLESNQRAANFLAAEAKRQEEQAREAAERLRAAPAYKRDITSAFAMLRPEHFKLAPPPGLIGEYVKATQAAMYNPFLKFAIPITFASLAGIVARKYKVQDGSGTNLNFIIAAPSASGKTQALQVWERFLNDANQQVDPLLNRIIAAGSLSIQGIFADWMAVPSNCWAIDECSAQLRMMSDPRTQVDIQVRDAYNRLFDVSNNNETFYPARSVSSARQAFMPIRNLCVSTCWATTLEGFNIVRKDIADGFLSRVLVIRHSGVAGEMQRKPQYKLPDALNERLVYLLTEAKRLDEEYVRNTIGASQQLVYVSSDYVADQIWELRRAAEFIKNEALRHNIPDMFVAVSRMPQIAIRMAAVMAVTENPFNPIIQPEQLNWAAGYALQVIQDLLRDYEEGQLGEKAASPELAVVRVIKDQIAKQGGVDKVSIADLRSLLIGRVPFTEKPNGKSASVIFTDTIDHMFKEGMIEKTVENKTGKRGRPAIYLSPTNDAIWD